MVSIFVLIVDQDYTYVERWYKLMKKLRRALV